MSRRFRIARYHAISLLTLFISMRGSAVWAPVLLAMLLTAAPGRAWSAELQEPALRGEAAPRPLLREDPQRPAEAPTAAAIDAVSAEDGAEAGLQLASKALDASRIAYGPRDPRTITPLVNLAHTKQRAGAAGAALMDYRMAIELAEKAGGPRDPRLYEAWNGVAYTHLAASQFESAVEAYETALQLHRVNQGLYSEEQIGLLHALAIATRASGKPEDADEWQMRRLDVGQRHYALGTPEVAQLYISVGRWYRSVGRANEAIGLHALAVEILERPSKDDPRLIEPLIELALSGSERRRGMDEGPLPGSMQPTAALARAEKLADMRRDGTAVERARAFLRLGDVHMGLARKEAALRVYAKASALLAGAGEKPPFDEPIFLKFQPPRPEPIPGKAGYVLAEFDIDDNGKVKDVRIVETQPSVLPPTVGARLSTALRAARLRPRIENGKTVASKGLRYRLPVRGGSA